MIAFCNLSSFVATFTFHTRSTHCHASLSVAACKLAFAGERSTFDSASNRFEMFLWDADGTWCPPVQELSMLVHGIKARFISPFRLQKQQAVGYSRFAKGFQFLSVSKNPSKPLHVVQGNKIAIKIWVFQSRCRDLWLWRENIFMHGERISCKLWNLFLFFFLNSNILLIDKVRLEISSTF